MSSKPNSHLIRGMVIGSVCGVVVGALATTIAGRAIVNFIGRIWDKLTGRQEGVDFRWLLQ